MLIAGDFDAVARVPRSPARCAPRCAATPRRSCASGGARSATEGAAARGSFSTALYTATTCEEIRFPWTRFAAPAAPRRPDRRRGGPDPGGRASYPFDRATPLDNDLIRLCGRWPEASPARRRAPPPGRCPTCRCC